MLTETGDQVHQPLAQTEQKWKTIDQIKNPQPFLLFSAAHFFSYRMMWIISAAVPAARECIKMIMLSVLSLASCLLQATILFHLRVKVYHTQELSYIADN